MHIQTLQKISLDELTACHNLAFSDYVVPHQITAQQLASSMHANSVQPELSPGAFDGDKLVGFVLSGVNESDGSRVFYNAGTGVIPAYRGRHIVHELYKYLLPLLEKIEVDYGILEVITENTKALRIYQALGYEKSRKLLCFKGAVLINRPSPGITIRPLENIDFLLLRSFWEWQPTWQNQIAAMMKILPELQVIGAFVDEDLSGYLIYNPLQKRVHQFAVRKSERRQGIGTALFSHVAQQSGEQMTVINVDERAEPTISFLESIGLKEFAQQYEMKLPLH